MPVRVGVDVGGTFTKAVACAIPSGEVIARSATPTSHSSKSGVADGVVKAIAGVMGEVRDSEAGRVLLVAHSTTQAVNALLEGDTSVVGVLGMGRRPDQRRSRRRTQVGEIRLAPGRKLTTVHEFLDTTAGLNRSDVIAALRRLTDRGAEVFCVSEAFGVEDARGEWMALEAARDLGVPVCAGHELTGLYGLEMRTVTGSLNASILPTALRTARFVEEALEDHVPGVPLLVMRGDGGAADLRTVKRHPLMTAFSGPAASVAGSLRHLHVHDGVVVEVGGTSTNISAIRGRRPVLSYVRVLDHVTCVRSLDVRVVGVAGGSLIRLRRRWGRLAVADVGPRSAHIAGLPYACFSREAEVSSAEPLLIPPRAGDPSEYLILQTPAGRRFALTPTCAANAAGMVPAGAYAVGDRRAARRAFEIAAAWIGTSALALANEVLRIAAAKVARAVDDAAREQKLESPAIVGVGGGAGALIPRVGAALGRQWSIPRDAEVISSVGDALSLVRVEVERTLTRPSPEAVAAVHREAENAAIVAGAAPSSLQLESETVPERSALRVAAFGAIALDSDVDASITNVAGRDLADIARDELGGDVEEIASTGFFSVFVAGFDGMRTYAVIDRHGSVAARGRGMVIVGSGHEVTNHLQERLRGLVRHFGPVAVAPAVRIVRGTRLVDLTLFSEPDKVLDAASIECSIAADDTVVALVSQE